MATRPPTKIEVGRRVVVGADRLLPAAGVDHLQQHRGHQRGDDHDDRQPQVAVRLDREQNELRFTGHLEPHAGWIDAAPSPAPPRNTAATDESIRGAPLDVRLVVAACSGRLDRCAST